MNRLRASLLQGAILALASACWLQGARAQVGSPPPGKAQVVLYRADRQPVAGRVPVIANADRLGELSNGEFLTAVVNPGRTFLRAGDRILTTLSLQTSAGQTYYVLMEAVPGQSPLRVEMREVTQATARSALAQSRVATPVAATAAAAPAAPALAPRAPAAVPAPLAAAPAASPPPRPAPAQPAPAAAPPPPRPAPAAAPPPPRQAQASPPPKPAPPPQRERPREPARDQGSEWTVAGIAKTGVFKLATASQDIGGAPSTYDKTSKPVAAIELEFRRHDGFALGGELLYYKNSFSSDVTTPAITGDQAVTAALFNVKYYLEATRWLYPFLGAGLGYGSASFSGDFTGKSSSFAFQGMAGADVRFSQSVGLYLEYKFVNLPTRDKDKQEIKAGGSGILVGLSFVF